MIDLATLRTDVQAHLGPSVGLGVADPTAPVDGLFPIEVSATGRMVDKRKREFAAGRKAARHAMRMIGLPVVSVPMGADRAPQWPGGLRGSISHCASAALAVTAKQPKVRALGIDVEENDPLEQPLWDTILTPAECARTTNGQDAKRIFCAKEAVYKAQYPITGQRLDFQDLEVTLDGSRFSARTTREVETWPTVTKGALIHSQNLFLGLVVVA